MVSVYVIESLSDGARYSGMAIDPNRRLVEHHAGKNRFTKGRRPGNERSHLQPAKQGGLDHLRR